MKDDADKTRQPAGEDAKGRRQHRLKLALRENLKRRKSQARERDDFMPASPGSDEVGRDGARKAPGK
jgi:hypothetical protein